MFAVKDILFFGQLFQANKDTVATLSDQETLFAETLMIDLERAFQEIGSFAGDFSTVIHTLDRLRAFGEGFMVAPSSSAASLAALKLIIRGVCASVSHSAVIFRTVPCTCS